MTFVDSVKICLSKYADFSGRAPRSEFWWFYLSIFLGSIVISFIAGMIGALIQSPFFSIIILVIYILATTLPLIAANVRRNHDSDKSGWFLLVPLYNLYLLVVPGSPGDNRFGAPTE